MAMLNESNLLAMKAKAAKFRTHHVGTKLNEAELHEFEALAERRKQTPSELIRGLVLGEIERDKQPPRASVELEEIASLRLDPERVSDIRTALHGAPITRERMEAGSPVAYLQREPVLARSGLEEVVMSRNRSLP